MLETSTPGYDRTWLYTNRRPYVDAQVWPMTLVSLTLLKPRVSRYRLVYADPICPAGISTFNNSRSNGNIYDFYDNALPSTSLSAVIFIDGMANFYDIVKKANGDIFLDLIAFGSRNSLILTAFALSFVLSIIGSILAFYLLYKLLTFTAAAYTEYINSQRGLSGNKKLVYGEKANQTEKEAR